MRALRRELAWVLANGGGEPTAKDVFDRARVGGSAGHWAALRALLAVYHRGERRLGGSDMDVREPSARVAKEWLAKGTGQLPTLAVHFSMQPATVMAHVARRLDSCTALRGRKALEGLLKDAASLL